MTVTIITGDCRDVLRTLPDESVHCVVTSPPYWGLRDYGVAGQLGLEETFSDYVDKIVSVFEAVRRVLRKDGTVWLNMGDCYATSAGTARSPGGIEPTHNGDRGVDWGYRTRALGTSSKRPAMGKHAYLEDRISIGPMSQPNRMPQAGLKPKDLVGMPWRVAFALQEAGWWLRQDIIWAKPNPMPESTKDRCTKAHEYIFLLSKSGRYYYDAIAIREPATDTGRENGRAGRDEEPGARPPSTNPRTLARIDYTKPRKIKVPGGWDRGAGAHGTIHRDGRTSAEYQEIEVAGGRNKRSVWEIATHAFPEAHFATFPPDLIVPCVLAGCPAGGTVLDPFGGAGTTGLVADRLQRNAILIELNPAYAAMARRRIDGDAPLFAGAAE